MDPKKQKSLAKILITRFPKRYPNFGNSPGLLFSGLKILDIELSGIPYVDLEQDKRS